MGGLMYYIEVKFLFLIDFQSTKFVDCN